MIQFSQPICSVSERLMHTTVSLLQTLPSSCPLTLIKFGLGVVSLGFLAQRKYCSLCFN